MKYLYVVSVQQADPDTQEVLSSYELTRISLGSDFHSLVSYLENHFALSEVGWEEKRSGGSL